MIYGLIVITKALTTERAGVCAGRPFNGAEREREREKAEISANKNLNKTVKHLYICLTLGQRRKGSYAQEEEERMRVSTYFFPFTSNPRVMCALCNLAWSGYIRALVSITEILSDPPSAF